MILNIGSLNLDHVYQVSHAVRPGETIASQGYRCGLGGKGLNQSVAAARAGAQVVHCGAIGADGNALRDQLLADGVDCQHLQTLSNTPSGHAIIQVAADGENCIVLFAGANHQLQVQHIAQACQYSPVGSWLMTQNETNLVADILRSGKARGLRVALNTAPANPSLLDLPLELVDLLVCNQSEAETLTGHSQADAALDALRQRCPQSFLVLTLGADGCRIDAQGERRHIPAHKVAVVDTTAAGDTFMGYVVAGLDAGRSVWEAAARASAAAALCVGRPGAAAAIPFAREINAGELASH